MLYSRFFKSLKPPLYVGLEVDTQQLNVPKHNVAYMIYCVNRTYIVLSYFSTLFIIKKITLLIVQNICYFLFKQLRKSWVHRFVPIFRKHVKLRPQFKNKRNLKKVPFYVIIYLASNLAKKVGTFSFYKLNVYLILIG